MKPEVKEEQKKNREEKDNIQKQETRESGTVESSEVNSGGMENPEKPSREGAKAGNGTGGESTEAEEVSREESETGEKIDGDESRAGDGPEGEEKSDAEDREGENGEASSSDASIKAHPEYKELQDKYMRLYAEFENYRRRTAKESLELVKTANAELLEKLIPVLENFALAFSPDRKAQKLEDFEKGVKMIYNSLKDVCDEVGLEEIHPEGEEFDPNLHEALMEQHHDKVPEGHVVQVFQKGYQIQSKILKHAKVITSKGPEKKEDVKKEG